MTITLSPGDPVADRGQTIATIYAADYGASGSIDLQISPRSDFQFCVAPTYSVARQNALLLGALNAGSTYFARARTRLASGVVEPWSNTVAFRTVNGPGRDTAPATIMIEPAVFVTPLPILRIMNGGMPGFPPTNLTRDAPVAFRMTELYPQGFYIDIETSGQPLDTIALLNTNLPEGAEWYVRAGNVRPLQESDFLYSSATLPFRASPKLPQRPGFHGLMRLPEAKTYPWWRIVIDKAPMISGMLQIDHLVMGLNRASKNHGLDKSETPLPLTTVDRRRSGAVDRVFGLPMRKVDFDLQMLSEAQYETIYGDLWRRQNEPVLVVPNSKAGAFLHDRILYGDLTGGRITNPASPRYTRSFTIDSII